MREAKAIYSELLRAKGLASVTCAGRGSEEGVSFLVEKSGLRGPDGAGGCRLSRGVSR